MGDAFMARQASTPPRSLHRGETRSAPIRLLGRLHTCVVLGEETSDWLQLGHKQCGQLLVPHRVAPIGRPLIDEHGDHGLLELEHDQPRAFAPVPRAVSTVALGVFAIAGASVAARGGARSRARTDAPGRRASRHRLCGRRALSSLHIGALVSGSIGTTLGLNVHTRHSDSRACILQRISSSAHEAASRWSCAGECAQLALHESNS